MPAMWFPFGIGPRHEPSFEKDPDVFGVYGDWERTPPSSRRVVTDHADWLALRHPAYRPRPENT